jgi:hypothetical protein
LLAETFAKFGAMRRAAELAVAELADWADSFTAIKTLHALPLTVTLTMSQLL